MAIEKTSEALGAAPEYARPWADAGDDFIAVPLTAGSGMILRQEAAATGVFSETATPAYSQIEDKLHCYLLDPAHPVGGPKATWLKQKLGFTRGNIGNLADQLEGQFDVTKATSRGLNSQGLEVYNQVIRIRGANGAVADVTFGWTIQADGTATLNTLIPPKSVILSSP
jgi:hypothetical protein